MTPQEALRYHLALLLASNGQSRVLAALAALLKLSEQELDAQLAALAKMEPKTAAKAEGSGSTRTLDVLLAQYPDKADALRTLNSRLVNKTFLAELRDVRRFLESHSHPAKSLKSRTDALPKILRVLATLDSNELKNLCEQPDSSDYSSLGTISDHIMGRDRR